MSFHLHSLGRWCRGQNQTNHSTWILHKHKWFSFFTGKRSWFQAIWNLTPYILCSKSSRGKLYLSDIQGKNKSKYFLRKRNPCAVLLLFSVIYSNFGKQSFVSFENKDIFCVCLCTHLNLKLLNIFPQDCFVFSTFSRTSVMSFTWLFLAFSLGWHDM